jgi:Ca2+-transporting ATPase
MVIAIVGIVRGQDLETLTLLCVSTAISAIPTGLPTFVQTILGSGVRKLAEQKAVVKTLTDVETLGGTTVINSDKAGTLTMNAMTATGLFTNAEWFSITGGGYAKEGLILTAAGADAPDFRRLALGLTLCSDATVGDDESIVGDPTEAALVVLAAKMGVDAEETRRTLPRRAEVPFDSEYKFMATVHDRHDWLAGSLLSGSQVMAVKGAPDVVLDRCSGAMRHGREVPIDDVRSDVIGANEELSKLGLRCWPWRSGTSTRRPWGRLRTIRWRVTNLVFVALVGIIDPLRAGAKDAVHMALGAGVDVRMITGDHTVTARAIADELGLGPGVITGSELARLDDADLQRQLPDLHVFGRVAPEDKMRLARLMQESGDVVAMTGDAVNDAAALKQADIGVAMGRGSEVTKQAAKIVLTDDNFATLVNAVDLGRDIYRRISTYIRPQLTVLSSVLQLMLLATIFNINGGVALFPMMLLFCKLFVVVTVVIAIIVDVRDPGVMQQPPRKPGTRISNRPQIVRWLISGFLVAVSALSVLQWGPDSPSTEHASVSRTMAFTIVAFSAVNVGLVPAP